MEACRTATVGEHILWNSTDGSRHKVCRAAHHPNYDISILHLERPVQMGLRAVRACLPTLKLADDFLAGKPMTVSGWGNTNTTHTSPQINRPNKLHVVKVWGVTLAMCRKLYQNPHGITAGDMCAGDITDGGEDSCQGDSGGTILNWVNSSEQLYIFDVFLYLITMLSIYLKVL